ncbi:MAG: Sec-independent protein translocase protein TatB, partial [Bradyrhizobium sp.]
DVDKPEEPSATPEIEPPVTATVPEAPIPETFVEAETHAAAEASVVAGEETHAAAEASVVADEEETASIPHDLAAAEPDELKDAKAS